MLRHPRRDRFAPQETPTRERREAAFASDEQKIPGSVPEGIEGQQEYRSPTSDTQDVLREIYEGTHFSMEAIVSAETPETLARSRAVRDALADIPRPPASLTNAMDALAQNDSTEHTEILADALKDPAAIIALIRSLESQQKRYRQFIDSLDKISGSGIAIGPNSNVREMLSRSDAAASIRELMNIHRGSGPKGAASLEQWIASAKPRELQRLLGVEERSSAFRRLVNVLQDQWDKATFKSGAWNDEKHDLNDKQKQKHQEKYFAEVEKHLEHLKRMLKEQLEAKAGAVTRHITDEIRSGLARTAGVDAASLTQITDTQAEAFAEKHGVTLEEVFEEMNVAAMRCKRARGLKIHAPDFVIRAEDFLLGDEARKQKGLLTEAQETTWEGAIAEAKAARPDLELWQKEFLTAYDKIPSLLRDERAAAFMGSIMGLTTADEVQRELKKFADLVRHPKDIQDVSEIEIIKSTALKFTQCIEKALSRNYHQVFAFTPGELSEDGFDEKVHQSQEKVTSVEKLLHASRIQTSNACRTIGITQKLGEQIRSAKGQLARATFSRDQARAALRELESKNDKESHEERMRMEQLLCATPAHVAVIRKQMEQMEQALTFIEKGIPREAKTTTKPCKGYCDFGKPEYGVNPEKHRKPPPNGPIDKADVRRSADHEFGHLVLDTLTERTSVFMGFFDEQQESFTAFAMSRLGTGQDVESLLEQASAAWGMDRAEVERDGDSIHAIGGREAYYRRKRWEEFLLTYATYRNKVDTFGEEYNLEKDPEFASEAERRLLRLLDTQYLENGRSTPAKDIAEFSKPFAGRHALAFRPEDEDDEEEHPLAHPPVENTEGNEPRVVIGPTLANFKTIRSQIQFIGNYLHTYPEADAGWLGETHRNAKEGYEKYFRQFDKHIDAETGNPKVNYRPEEDGPFGNIIREAINQLKIIEQQIKDRDGKNMRGVADAKPEGKEFWLWFTRDIQWLSIMDYWTMCKEGWEDISRLWKRRGENARGKVGELLTGWIGDKIPYFGQLKHEFHRRQQSSEQEQVGVWEKALENVDSYKLIEEIQHVNNQDHLKAVMILLTKRGRLDWDDPNLWVALSRFSHFKIPIEECHRDPVLLDKWLQKVIADIWHDKDLYRTWKTNNEHEYNSARDRYSGVADYYSNAGLLGSQLAYMLETFVEAKENHKPIPDQVNPHLYEELFLYAMEKGKMSMQEKFFYLIQGLHYKIIPFDRLSILVGKIGTETFPFIDYFYQQNNTEKEIKELAASLIESKDDKSKRFKPGPKTTAFLIEEVAHDENSRQRVTKVISRKGNNIDHEDVPMVTGYMTQGGWNNFLIVATGAVQRLTSEGLKNAYVGYSTLFKTYGMLAEKKAEHGQSLAPSDVAYLAERIVAFAHYDNVVVRQAIDNKIRPILSLREIENETMPSGNGLKAMEYRDPVSNLVNAVFEEYGTELAAELGSKNLRNSEGVAIDYDAFRKEYLGVDDQGNQVKDEKPMGANDKRGGHIFNMSGLVENALIKAVNRDKGAKLITLLRQRKDNFINEGEVQLNYDRHKEIFNRQERFKKVNGNGNGGGEH